MRVKVRAIEPRVDDAELEELAVEPMVRHTRPVTAADLGPQGSAVLDLLSRASRLTPAECRSLEKEAAWQWWLLTPLPGLGLPAARALALVLARADGRTAALAGLEAAVAAIMLGAGGSRARRARLRACISNAGLAVLAGDLLEPAAFATLVGPWREVVRD